MSEAKQEVGEAWWTESAAEEWSDAIVAAMKLGGIDNLFFVSGAELTFFQEAIAKAHAKGRPAPRLMTMTHEHVALNAALGDAMVRGQPSAAAVHVDVGTLHYGAAIHTAWKGGYPVMMIGGTGPRAYPGSMRGARNRIIQWSQEPRDQNGIVRQFTKMDHRMEHQDNPGLMVSRLLQVAMSEPKGPVYLSIPQETAMLPLSGTARFPSRDQLGVARGVWPDPDDAKTIAKWLVRSENPVMYTTKAAHDPSAVAELVRLAELLAIPVQESANADRLNFPVTHWAYGTGPAANEADVVLVMEDTVPFIPGRNSPKADAKIAWVSIDPVLSQYKTMEFRADLWIPSSVTGAARAICDAATSMLSNTDMARIADRRSRLEGRRREITAQEDAMAREDVKQGKLSGRVVGYELGKLLETDAIVLNDGLSNGGFVHMYARRTNPGTYFRSGSSSGGWGNGASLGVKLARPNQDVVLASGDGYYMFGSPLPALWASSHHKAAYLAVIFVNASYSTGTSALRSAYPDGYAASADCEGGTFDPPPNFAKLAETVNGYGEQVTELAQLPAALKRGLDHTRNNTPAIVAVNVPGPMQGVGSW